MQSRFTGNLRFRCSLCIGMTGFDEKLELERSIFKSKFKVYYKGILDGSELIQIYTDIKLTYTILYGIV